MEWDIQNYVHIWGSERGTYYTEYAVPVCKFLNLGLGGGVGVVFVTVAEVVVDEFVYCK